ncbi:MlaD family protein [Saccharicrinis fermentans]|uniref:Virulence factor Mce family protein n=1 Tax=Saccharicrinis fermentans DSM 9555 = JCM 21142 TaxID=869213 RepID=W7YFG6_9BACT|nr:MlaD family protein [Saccharicrinis fermentans]GAF03181.1 virulence factor Mce family protein [Saccharicrinis fermentans DSM 9555 = JCM 21142]
MAKISKEAKVGLTVGLAIFIFAWGINFLKGKDIFTPGYKVHGIYSRIDGLTESSPIYYKGFQIGSVRKISLLAGGNSDLLVTMAIEKDIDFPKNTVAQIYSLDLMGSKGIRFVYGNSPDLIEAGDTLSTSVTGDLADQVSQEVLPLKDKVENMVVGLDSILTNLNRFLSEENKNSLSSGMNDFSGMMRNLNQISASINYSLKEKGSLDNTLANLEAVSLVLKANGEALSALMKNMESASGQLADAHIDSLAHKMSNTFVSVNTLLTSLNRGEGTVGKLMSDEQLYDNMNNVSVSLDRLLNDVREQPKRYVNFSAVSFGGGKAEKKKDQKTVYKLLLKKSKAPLDLRGVELGEDKYVREERSGKFYLYTIGEEQRKEALLGLKNDISDRYPDAQIVTFRGGKMVKK